MASFDEWSTDPDVTLAGLRAFTARREQIGRPYLGRYAVWLTTGTSTEPGLIAHDRSALATYQALSLVRGWLPWLTPARLQALLRGHRIAMVVATDRHYSAEGSARVAASGKAWARNQLGLFSVFSPLPDLVAALNDYRPDELIAYPSTLALLAAERIAGRLRVEPSLLGSGGEWLTGLMRRTITAAFACPLRESYGANEFIPVAWECLRGRLHVNADWVILEPVDEHFRPVPVGQPSHTALLTNLINRVQPIIRYDLGDSITLLPGRCACNSPLPTIRLEGRREETLTLGGSGQRAVCLSTSTIERAAGMSAYQVIQTGPASLRVRLATQPGRDRLAVWSAVHHQLHADLAARGLDSIALELDHEPPARLSTTSKYRAVWSELTTAGDLAGLT